MRGLFFFIAWLRLRRERMEAKRMEVKTPVLTGEEEHELS